MASILVVILVIFVVPFFILGVLGNIGVMLCVVFTPSLRTRSNAIIVSLTTSCLAFLVTVVPFTLDSFIYTDWRFAVWYCHVTANLTFLFIGITVFNIAVLSLFRYFCVVHPFRLFLRSRATLIILISIAWLVPLITQTLISAFHVAHTEYVPMYARCVVVKVGEHSTLYNILVLGGFLPTLGVTLYSYAGIYATVRASARRLRRQSEMSSRPTLQVETAANQGLSAAAGSMNHVHNGRTSNVSRRRRGRENLTRICVVVFVLFMVCYGPIITLTAIYTKDTFPAAAYMICTVIYWLGSCLHPLIYAVLQPRIRRSFLRVAGCCCRSVHRPSNESSIAAVTTGHES